MVWVEVAFTVRMPFASTLVLSRYAFTSSESGSVSAVRMPFTRRCRLPTRLRVTAAPMDTPAPPMPPPPATETAATVAVSVEISIALTSTSPVAATLASWANARTLPFTSLEAAAPAPLMPTPPKVPMPTASDAAAEVAVMCASCFASRDRLPPVADTRSTWPSVAAVSST